MSMIGSGIYSTTLTHEIVCAEKCSSCMDEDKTCDNVWEEDFETDDRGSIDTEVKCEICNHDITIQEA